MAARQRALQASAVPYVEEINALADRLARPLPSHPGLGGAVRPAGDGPAFAQAYGAR